MPCSPIYFCHTVYHLLISLCKLRQHSATLVLFDKIPERDRLVYNLKKEFPNLTVICRTVADEDFSDIILANQQDIYLFNESTRITRYLNENRIGYHAIEDGYNFYQHLGNNLFKYYYWRFIQRNRTFATLSPFLKSIEVNSTHGLVKGLFAPKWVEVPRKQLFNALSNEERQKIYQVFEFSPPKETIRGVLVLTQPLAFQNWDEEVATVEKQVIYYKEIVKKYGGQEQVYLKVHPRDWIDYSSLSDVIFLPREIPVEFYDFCSNVHFSKGIAHTSTVLDFLSCVDDKIYLGEIPKWIRKFD